ncbi:hypothetical protein FACS1894200_02170 [Spirochaetia bacterium]|nr:hypothetical protein FACS1894200_02170 [Spirochaetia bacterium]
MNLSTYIIVALSCVCVAIWSGTYVWTKKLTDVFTDIELVLIRSIIAYIVLLVAAIPFPASSVIPLSNWKTNFKQEFLFLLLGGIGQYGFQFLSARAVRKSNPVIVSVICL